jgi:hypothetical protein
MANDVEMKTALAQCLSEFGKVESKKLIDPETGGYYWRILIWGFDGLVYGCKSEEFGADSNLLVYVRTFKALLLQMRTLQASGAFENKGIDPEIHRYKFESEDQK